MNLRSAGMTTTIEIGEHPPTLSDLLRLTEQGNEVALTNAGRLVATLIPAPAKAPASSDLPPRTPGLQPGAIVILSDDWDAPLPDDFWFGESS
jgi:antitoxin (DNA-binding transcriptional repressor) of toxin-antitoxin stability system